MGSNLRFRFALKTKTEGLALSRRAKNKLIVDRTVTSIGPKDVPQSMIAIPKGYRDLTPKAGKKAD